MNERIKQLAEQAGVPYQIELEEFARLLIVQYNKETKESRRAVKSQLGYSRVGLKNI
jgi:hypothetical protein